jgi:SAM-dependent methyltransferase
MLNREIRKYYLSINEEEVISDISQKKFDIWELMEKFRRELGVERRLIDIGGGMGYFAYNALKEGYDVIMIDALEEFVKKAGEKYPELKERVYVVDIFNEENVSKFIDKLGQFDVVTVLGSVPNHAVNKKKLKRGLYNILKFGNTNSLLVIDLLLEEMFPEKPSTIWSDFKHTLASFSDIGLFLRKYGLRILDLYSIHESYPSKRGSREYEEHSIRFFIHKPW